MTEGGGGTLWGGRFGSDLHPAIHSFTNSLPFDRRLAGFDLIGSLAHARMLRDMDILSREDADAILEGLSGMLEDLESGKLVVEGPDEDVHSWLERTLTERIGEPAGWLHTARSRNDQTSIALRLYTRDALERLAARLLDLQAALLEAAEPHAETPLPGYTHVQRGQPITLGHHLLAHFWALAADVDRVRRAHAQAGTSPLGAGALAGTSFPIDPLRTAALLGFASIYSNSIFAVADRDYVLEAAFCAATLMTHLSRWADEIILWTTSEFGFATLADSVSQGSSIMPQKKNPEAAEIVRGKAARSIGHLTALLTLVKGLPFAYNSDFQEDKEALFDTLDTATRSAEAASVLTRGLEFQTERMRKALFGGMLTATELADYLVRKGTPFRTAHEQVGAAVRAAEEHGCELHELPPTVLGECCPGVETDVARVLDPEHTAGAHDSPGGPAPVRVREQLARARRMLEAGREWLVSNEPPPIYLAHQDGTLDREDLL